MSATNAYSKFSPRDKLATARLAARQRYPYFSSALLNLIPREAPGLGTLGVTESMLLLWDPDAVARWSLEKLTGVLVHEVGHILRAHARRAKALGIIGQDGRPLDPQLAKLWNVAGDLEINDDLAENHPECFLPNDLEAGLLPKKFKLEDGLTAEAYYADLRQQQEEQNEGDGQDGEGDGDGSEGKGGGPGGDPMRGRCGSCAGNPVDGEPKGEGSNGQGNEGRSEVEVERVRKEVAEAVKAEVSRGRGSVPAGWARWADATLTPPKVRWQDKLARICRNAVAWKAGAVDLHHRTMSRRQWGIGIGPGRPMLPALRAPIPHIGVIVDTSGSMGQSELNAALRETKGILTGVGARITFSANDAEVHELKTVTNWQELAKLLKGGGGTDFRPAFDAMEKAKPRPDVVVYITDGDGPAPDVAPAWCRTIWLLVGAHRRVPCSWGEFIELED